MATFDPKARAACFPSNQAGTRTPSRPRAVASLAARRCDLALAAVVAMLTCVLTPSAEAHLSIIHQGSESADIADPNDRFGATLATGDFDGDGYDDLAMGAPGETVGALSNAGAVVVSFGSAHGITHVGARFITATSLGYASQAGAQFGFAVHAADINQDGYCDLLIGAPYETVNGHPHAGSFYFVFGTASGPMSVGTAFTQANVAGGFVEDGDRFGFSFATGNFDGDADGYVDLAVGTPGESGIGAVVRNFLGGPLGPNTSQTSLFFQSNLGGLDNLLDGFGTVLAAGNVRGTSHDDLVIGAPGAQGSAGRIWVLAGNDAGISIASPLSYTATSKDASQPGGRFGDALAVGHCFGAAYDALVIGEWGRTVDGFQNAGRVLVVKGANGGLDFTGTNCRILSENSGGAGIAGPNHYFGAAVAAGQFNVPDGFDDVAVGVPGWSSGTAIGAGATYIFPGGLNGPTGAGWSGFNQGNCNDPVESGDRFGHALAYGSFDNTDRASLAVGAPNEDLYFGGVFSFPDAGQVHDIAPWRQVFNLTSSTGVMGDCYGTPLFSFGPFQPVYIASTTKIMTILLAAESVQAGFDPNTPYTVPAWVASDAYVDGSQVFPELVAGESVTLIDLMYMCLRFSGNDAAFAIADILYGGEGQWSYPDYVNNVVAFVGEMNARAASLGMTGTHFTNPPGYDWEHAWLPTGNVHYSTAYDMWLLGKTAIANTVFAQICGLNNHTATRNGMPFPVPPGYASSFMDPKVIGLKDGGTNKAKITGVFATTNPNGPGPLVGSLMRILGNPQAEGRAMMNMALAQCSSPHVISDEIAAFRFPLANIPTRIDARKLAGSLFGGSTSDDMKIDLHRQSGSQPTALHFELGRQSEVLIQPGTSLPFGIAPFEAHEGYEIANLDSVAHTIRVHLAAGVVSNYTIEPDSVVQVPPFSTGGTGQWPSYDVQIENTGLSEAYLSVHEHYTYDFSNIPAPDPDPAIRLTLRRVGMLHDGFWVATEGRDPDGDPSGEESMMFLAVHDPDVPDVGVDDPPAVAPGTSVLRLLPPVPNPSSGRARLGLELARPARVGIEIHDLQGRLVRRFAERAMAAGHSDVEWEGLADDGRPVRSGLYFIRTMIDGTRGDSGTIVVAK